MRTVVQRVSRAELSVNGAFYCSIGPGLLLLVAVEKSDTRADADYLAAKIPALRIFPDESGRMNRSVRDIQGSLLIISNFTLCGDTRKGKRPSFDSAAPPEEARPLYNYFIDQLNQTGISVETGVFQAHMNVLLVNDGPVTLICESRTVAA